MPGSADLVVHNSFFNITNGIKKCLNEKKGHWEHPEEFSKEIKKDLKRKKKQKRMIKENLKLGNWYILVFATRKKVFN